MLTPRLALALAGAALFTTAGPAPLRVMRVSPSGDASPAATIAVTFDRPVAGSLDRTVPPEGLLRIEPAVAGRAEWRDPVTLRFIPARMLAGGTRYTVTVSNEFRAMDGTRLEEPYTFSFRVHGPRLLGGMPSDARTGARNLRPDARFQTVWSAPVDPARLAARAYIELARACPGERTVRVRVTGQRPLAREEGYRYRRWTGLPDESVEDSLRRIVELVPVTPLPLDCAGALTLPSELSADGDQMQSFNFHTYRPLRIVSAQCEWGSQYCPTGPLSVQFETPVRGSEVQRHVRIFPATPFVVRDTAGERERWVLEATLKPRVRYAIAVDTALRDIFGQKLGGNPAAAVATTGYAPSVSYPFGRLLVERRAFRTIAVQHINVDTLVVQMAAIPDSLEAVALARAPWGWSDLWTQLAPRATERRIAVRGEQDRSRVTGIAIPAGNATRGEPTLYAVRVLDANETRDVRQQRSAPIALVQVTDLGVHAKVGLEEGAVWVTGASDGLPRANAEIALHDAKGRVLARARSDATGLARLTGYGDATGASDDEERAWYGFEGFVAVKWRDDRAVAAVSEYDPDLGPWQFGVSPAWGSGRLQAAGAVFTERGIYRPGEEVWAKAIVRTGPLGALRAPARGDSLRWQFRDREDAVVKDTVVALSAFGTAAHRLTIPAGAALGHYEVRTQLRRAGRWLDVGRAGYRVAEYRPPEFLVDLTTDSAPRSPGDTLRARIAARYLFGAPMGRAAVTWAAHHQPMSPWALQIPGLDGWHLGETSWAFDDEIGEPANEARVFASGTDTLDAAGTRVLSAVLPQPRRGLAARVTVQASVMDVNRQTVGVSTGIVVHPAGFYIAAKPQGESWFWTAGTPQAIAVLAVRPDGRRLPGVAVRGALVRREWHQVHRERDGVAQTVGEWVADTVDRCAPVTADEPVTCTLTPRAGGSYVVAFSATDARGRAVTTTFDRWATGEGWVPWSDENRFKMDVVADRERYSVGDTATVLFASPFTDAEAWVTVEREGLLEQRRMRLTSGSTTLKFPITEAWAPNAFVSIVVARGRSAPPGPLDDPGRPTIRVGYAELRVTPEVKRLAVRVQPRTAEYRPGDTARIALQVSDARGRGQRSEVTLWAVDEGVLALTGYRTPDPLDLLYQPRGLGLRLTSNLSSVAPQVPEGDKGRAPGGGGGAAGAEILRSRFKTTAFFLGSVVTDSSGAAEVSAPLPDNLTTFRVMAVAVTTADRFGSGESPLLVTRPLIARPALPRFVRPGDELLAGAVINQRAGGTPTVRVEASARGITLRGRPTQEARLEAGRGREVRFPFRATAGADSASFRFAVSGAGDADAVLRSVPVRPEFPPRAHTIAGALRDTATVVFELPAGTDPARSRLELSLGSSPLSIIRGAERDMRVYPYGCTEQVLSSAFPILALVRVQRATGAAQLRGDPMRELVSAVEILARRQRPDGAIGFWSADDWSTPWLSAYAGHFLLDARAAGVPVRDSMLVRLAEYLSAVVREADVRIMPVMWRTIHPSERLRERVAAADFLSRMGRPDVAAENELLRTAAQMTLEDRARLAETLARRGAMAPARALLETVWALTRVEGRRATLPDSVGPYDFYFRSTLRPAARLLTATLAVDSAHTLIGPLVETIVQQQRAQGRWGWTTQDYGAAVVALAEFERRQRGAAERGIRVRGGRRVLFDTRARDTGDSTIALTGLLEPARGETQAVRLTLESEAGAPSYYYLTIREVPLAPPERPDEEGIRVERWYERFDGGQPIVSAAEGDLVRVRLRITVPRDRQFVVVDDALPAGLEAIDLGLRTASALPGPGAMQAVPAEGEPEAERENVEGAESGLAYWAFGSWDSGWWSPFDHKELRDDRVVYFATVLWQGTYTATYLARATTPGTFVRPPAQAEEMYNPAVRGRTEGGVFTVTPKSR